MMTRLVVAAMALAAPGFAAGEFDKLVSAIESHYSIHRTHIPLMGAANLALMIAHPGGTRAVKVAILQDLDSCERCFDLEELDGVIAQLTDGDLRTLLRIHQHGEATYVLTGQVGKVTKTLVATFGYREAVIVQVDLDMKTLLRLIGGNPRAGDWEDAGR